MQNCCCGQHTLSPPPGMDLSLQSLHIAPWQLREIAGAVGRARRPARIGHHYEQMSKFCVQCSHGPETGEQEKEKEKESSSSSSSSSLQEKPVAASLPHASWLPSDAETNDYAGWTSAESHRSERNILQGAVKIGGVLLLALGFTLGARSLHTRKDVTVKPPAQEQIISSTASVTDENKTDLSDVSESEITTNMKQDEPLLDDSLLDTGNKDDTSPEPQDYSSDIQDNIDASASATDSAFNTPDENESDGNNPDQAYEERDTNGELGGLAMVHEVTNHDDSDAVSEALTSPSESLVLPTDANDARIEKQQMSNLFLEREASANTTDPSSATSGAEPVSHQSLANDEKQVRNTDEESSRGMLTGIDDCPNKDFANIWETVANDVEQFAASNLGGQNLYAALIAPSTPSAVLPKDLGSLLVPAPNDQMQSQVLAALQMLKVVEAGVEPGGICTRREYARWLIAASAILSRNPAQKVYPAMYIENASKLAFDDVKPEDPDFPFIQGLAEAGMISSRLLRDDQDAGKGVGEATHENYAAYFSPDSPVTRQDLITWRIALQRKSLPQVGITTRLRKEALQELSGFVDIDRIHHDAWPALGVDLLSGDKSITSLAFGFTRRFQPERPVTKAQAAIALASGDAWELVTEELARLEAESIAEAAIAAELDLELKTKQEVAGAFNELLQGEKEKKEVLASLAETARAELEKLKTEREAEKYSLWKEQAILDSEKDFLAKLRQELEEQVLALSSAKLEVAFAREQVEKLHREAKEEREIASQVRSELEIEKKALLMARDWAKEEAREDSARSLSYKQTRARDENPGLVTNIRKEGQESNIPVLHNSEMQTEMNIPDATSKDAESWTKGLPSMDSFISKGRDLLKVIIGVLARFFHYLLTVWYYFKQRASELLGGLNENFREARTRCASLTSKRMEDIQQKVPSYASSIREGTWKAVGEWKGGAERLAGKFKSS